MTNSTISKIIGRKTNVKKHKTIVNIKNKVLISRLTQDDNPDKKNEWEVT